VFAWRGVSSLFSCCFRHSSTASVYVHITRTCQCPVFHALSHRLKRTPQQGRIVRTIHIINIQSPPITRWPQACGWCRSRGAPAARCASPHAARRCVYRFALACSGYAPVTCSKFRHMRLADSRQCVMGYMDHPRRITHVATPAPIGCNRSFAVLYTTGGQSQVQTRWFRPRRRRVHR
jgi:hypothetical protein